MSGSENSPSPQSDVPAPRVVVLDHGSGNVRSAVRALEASGADVELTADRDSALGADGLVVPGVGAFAATAAQIRAVGGDRIIERRLAGGLPVLGICVGLQVMFAAGTEHGERAAGLDQWPGEITRLEADVVPHMGWNTVEVPQGSRLFAGIEDERFYFVHSYAARSWELESQPPMPDPLVTWSDHGGDRFVAAVENGALTATQFHPEKSGGAGTRLLRNWLAGLPRLATRSAAS
ncbi:imidazole glycerol phosphate synthase subunit HisH [Brachybacterium sp. MASK1Z-5]|uniref:Imidazole glycerol phosphate synthase subunit HisH n=1 Tax=Brachybacterium halotolerans TaxID=2795215 RepID=A0ABS1B8V8_9MICO|nr:imidazole glycerol phosphate synthase subunit HisH [Brachybacterium halotolerans]MBK0331061.1 imidazole glycerol phosphate synthase subunit HisH [Brachybacterium halotolerans]